MDRFIERISKIFERSITTMGMETENDFCTGEGNLDEETEERIRRLDELTASLDFGNVTTPHGGTTDFVELETEIGTGFMFGLLKSRGIAVSKLYMSAGTIIAKHFHPEWLCLVIWKGEIDIDFNGSTRNMQPPDCFYIDSMIAHKLIAKKESWAIAITIPPSNQFPDGPFTFRTLETKIGETNGT